MTLELLDAVRRASTKRVCERSGVFRPPAWPQEPEGRTWLKDLVVDPPPPPPRQGPAVIFEFL